jgi:hypothetical protein
MIHIKSKRFAPIPVAARSKASVYGRSIAGIAGSNSAGTWISVSCKCCVFYRCRSLRRADHSSRVVLPGVVCLIE